MDAPDDERRDRADHLCSREEAMTPCVRISSLALSLEEVTLYFENETLMLPGER